MRSDPGDSDDGALRAVGLPWRPRTRQEQGRASEAQQLKRRGAKVHPGSGSGVIPFDGSTDIEVIELKDVATSFTLNAKYIKRLFIEAARTGKQGVLVIHFRSIGMTLECTIKKEQVQ